MNDWWWQALVALGYGIVGSVIPVFNSEAYIVAGVTAGLGSPVLMGCLLALGQGIGKFGLFMAIREGRRLPGPWRRRIAQGDDHIDEAPDVPSTPSTRRWQRVKAGWLQVLHTGVKIAEHPKWGPVGMVSAGMLSIPPNFPTTILLATTKVNPFKFVFRLSLGFAVRYIVIGYAATGVLARFGITLR